MPNSFLRQNVQNYVDDQEMLNTFGSMSSVWEYQFLVFDKKVQMCSTFNPPYEKHVGTKNKVRNKY